MVKRFFGTGPITKQADMNTIELSLDANNFVVLVAVGHPGMIQPSKAKSVQKLVMLVKN